MAGMDPVESGRKGGITTLFKFGIEYCPCCGQLKQNDYFKQLGDKGTKKLHALYPKGHEHWKEIGGKGGRGNKRQPGP